MTKRRMLLAIVFGSMLAITGCGGDEGGGDGTGATNGTGATGGGVSNPSNTCEAFCGSSCVVEGIDPGDDFDNCLTGCSMVFSDECGSQAEVFVSCLESVDCDDNAAANECQSQAIAWGQCVADVGMF